MIKIKTRMAFPMVATTVPTVPIGTMIWMIFPTVATIASAYTIL